MTTLLKAFCRAGHSWDVWGEETPDGRFEVLPVDQFCPSCLPPLLPGEIPARAVRYEEPESLA